MRGRPPTRVTIRGISHTLTSRYWGDALGKPQFLSSLLKSVLTSSARDELSRDAVQEATWAQLDPNDFRAGLSGTPLFTTSKFRRHLTTYSTTQNVNCIVVLLIE
jgi:hypothetical protein